MSFKIEAFQWGPEEKVGFRSNANIDDKVIFNEAIKRLRVIPGINVGRKQIGPWVDYYICKLDGHEFTVFFDIDYEDVTIHVENEVIRKKIIALFNEPQQ